MVINFHYKKDSDKLGETSNKNCTYHYLHDLININDFDIQNILLDEKPYEVVFSKRTVKETNIRH